ncbi:MAG: DEAD/DEAH box helicase [Oscillospiraceae bacterium]|nr:DEAD/DEAH box helicase [Oscillospiraceae bacterium]
MKKEQRAQREYEFIKKSLPKFKKQMMETKSSKLWHMESIIRQKIKDLKLLPSHDLDGYKEITDGYMSLLCEISERLLENYNKSNKTDYRFNDVVREDYRGYLDSGIISILITSHLPKIVIEEFQRLLPENPKDEYQEARKMRRKFFLHLGETNTGKTYDALQRLKQCGGGVYLAPLRILALENYERLNAEGIPCNLLTGEEELHVNGAHHASCTIEKVDIRRPYDVAVIDEIQLLSDSHRGDAWTRAVLGLCCPEIHICGALNAKEQIMRMIRDCGDDYEITEYSRLIPLQTLKANIRFNDIEPGDALIAFSRKGVLSLSRYFSEKGIKNSIIYGDLPPEVRRMQYDAFLSGKSNILISTDAIGMGVNLPIRRIIFTELEKYDGEQHRILTSQEIKQIAGRAGRVGIYDIGYVACTDGDSCFVEDQLLIPDAEIPCAVVGPSEAILDIGMLPLREKLALWSTRAESLNYYRKKDVRDLILVLDKLQPFRLPETVQWRLMMLPFDVHSEELLNQFLVYADEAFNMNASCLSKPELYSHMLSECEVYYQKINLYYSFSKSIGLYFDEQWVYNARRQISDEINRLL